MGIRATLAILVGYGFGLFAAVAAFRKGRAARRSQQWRSTPGTILESTTFVDDSKRTHFRVRYEFVGIQKMEGNTPRISGDWFWNNRQQEEFVARYRPGQSVEVFFDPTDPRRNCLDRTDTSGITALWVLALGGIAAASMLVWLLEDEVQAALLGLAARI